MPSGKLMVLRLAKLLKAVWLALILATVSVTLMLICEPKAERLLALLAMLAAVSVTLLKLRRPPVCHPQEL